MLGRGGTRIRYGAETDSVMQGIRENRPDWPLDAFCASMSVFNYVEFFR